jgi:hypothetical protein
MGLLSRVFGQSPPPKPGPATEQEAFDQARALASDERSRQVVLVRTDLPLFCLACSAPGSVPSEVVAQMEAIDISVNFPPGDDSEIPLLGILDGRTRVETPLSVAASRHYLVLRETPRQGCCPPRRQSLPATPVIGAMQNGERGV